MITATDHVFYLKGIKTVTQLNVHQKVVFLRLDLNVPIKNEEIQDLTRIKESLPTIQFLLEQKAKLIIASHLGRPKGPQDKQFSLLPVGQKIAELLKIEVILAEDMSSDFIKPTLTGLTKNQVILLENLRYFEGETTNSEDLAKIWANYCDVYVNDAFGASHRAHASIDQLPRMIKEKGCGFLIKKELEMLGRLLESPEEPFFAILGGSKISDKIPLIENLLNRVQGLIIGGAMAYTFLKAKGFSVGKSLVEVEQLNYCRELLERLNTRKKSLYLPIDHVCALTPKDQKSSSITIDEKISDHEIGVDIGPKTIELFKKVIQQAKTIFWNGPMGIFETSDFAKGTFAVAQALAHHESCFRVIGGGDSVSAVNQAGVAHKINHISTGGGASLEFIQGLKLPGIEALREKR